jgi:hypothetical protein
MLCIVGLDILYNKLITLPLSRDSGFVQPLLYRLFSV